MKMYSHDCNKQRRTFINSWNIEKCFST